MKNRIRKQNKLQSFRTINRERASRSHQRRYLFLGGYWNKGELLFSWPKKKKRNRLMYEEILTLASRPNVSSMKSHGSPSCRDPTNAGKVRRLLWTPTKGSPTWTMHSVERRKERRTWEKYYEKGFAFPTVLFAIFWHHIEQQSAILDSIWIYRRALHLLLSCFEALNMAHTTHR